jgi:hypothetical protein
MHINPHLASTFTTARHTNQERKLNVTRVAARHAAIVTILHVGHLLPHLVITTRRHVITMSGIITSVIVTTGIDAKRIDIMQTGIVTIDIVEMIVTVTTSVIVLAPLHQEIITEIIPPLHIVAPHHHQDMNLETDITLDHHLQDHPSDLLPQGDHGLQNIEAADDTNKAKLMKLLVLMIKTK